MTIYKDKNRKVGSQSEIPSMLYHTDLKMISVSGYQNFNIYDTGKLDYRSKKEKFLLIEKILRELYPDPSDKSITDIGCSAGLVSLIATTVGFKKIIAIDHDPEYIQVLNYLVDRFNLTSIQPKVGSFGEGLEKSDVVLMLALVHWIYSCTGLYGNFKSLFLDVKPFINDYLLIEWIDPEDPAIKSFNHIKYNSSIIQEEYSLKNFETALTETIGDIQDKIKLDGPTRVLYVVKSN